MATTKTIEWIKTQKSAAQSASRQFYEPDWIYNVQHYMNYLHTEMAVGADWVRSNMIPDAFRGIETFVSQIVPAMYDNPRFFSVEAPSIPGSVWHEAVASLLLQKTRQASYVERSIPSVRMGTITGHSIQKVYWASDFGDRQTRITNPEANADGEPITVDLEVPIFNGPWAEWPDLMACWKSPEVDRFGNPLWWIETRDYTVDLLEREDAPFRSVGGLYNRNTLKALRKGISLRPNERSSGRSNPFQHSGMDEAGPYHNQFLQDYVSGTSRGQRKGANAVAKQEFWGYVPPSIHPYPDTQWRLIELANWEAELRDVPLPTPDRRPPFKDVYQIRVGDEPYGRAPLRWAIPEIEQRSRHRNLGEAELIANIFTKHMLNEAYVDVNDMGNLINAPGGYIPINAEGIPLNQVLQPVPRPPVNQERFMEDQSLEGLIMKTLSTTDPFQGGFASKRMQATEFQGTVALGQARHQMAVMMDDMQRKHHWLSSAFRLCQLNMTQPEIIALRGNHNVRGDVDADFLSLTEDVDIHLHGGEFGNLDAMKLNAINQLFGQALSTNEGQLAIKLRDLLRDAAYYAGLPRGDQYLYTEDEVEARREQQIEAALAEAALGASQGQGAGAS